MNTQAIRGMLHSGAFLGGLALIGSISMAAEPLVSAANVKSASVAAIPVVAVIKPVAFVLCTSEGDGANEKCAALGGTQNFSVTGNRTLLIEQITGYCFGTQVSLPPLPQRIAVNVVTGGVAVDHILLGTRQNNVFEGYSDDTRLYADPGSTISVDITGIAPSPSGRLCRLSFSGQFVK